MPNYGGGGVGSEPDEHDETSMGEDEKEDENNGRTKSSIGPAKEVDLDMPEQEMEKSDFNDEGISGFNTLDGVTTENSFGIDTHHTLNGIEFDLFNELAADTLDVFDLEINQTNLDITKDIYVVAIGMIMGAPALSLGVKALSISANVATLNGYMSAETNKNIQMFSAVVGLLNSSYSSLQSFSLGMDAINAGYYGIGVAMTTASILDLSMGFQSLEGLLGPGTYSDIDFGDYKQEGESLIGIPLLKKAIAQKKQEQKSRSTYLRHFASLKAFDYLAGGEYYNSFLAGGIMFNPQGIENPSNIAVGLPSMQVNRSFVESNNFLYSGKAGDMNNNYAGSEDFNPLEFSQNLFKI